MQRPWTDKVYSAGYADPSLRGVEAPRPWDIAQVIREHATPASCLLDVGCGIARKILPLAAHLKEVVGLEPSGEMRADARAAAEVMDVTNFSIVEGTAEHLPFPDDRFDIVSSMLAPHDYREFWRVLKPGGVVIVEKIGGGDKANLKAVFGSDDDGPRGQFMVPEEERQEALRSELAAVFGDVLVRSGKWRTVFTVEGLAKLLYETNTIRNFDLAKDAPALRQIERQFSSPEGIETSQHRLLFIARKPL